MTGSGIRLILSGLGIRVVLAAGAAAVVLTLLGLRFGALPVAALAALALVPRLATRPTWAIGLVVLALPVGLSTVGALGPVDPVQVVAVLAVAVIAFQRLAAGLPPLRWHPSAGWAIAFLLCATVATANARDMALGARQLAAVTVAVLLALAVHTACDGPRSVRRIVLLLAVVGGALCLFSLRDAGQIQSLSGAAGAVDNRAVGIFRQPNELGTFSALIFFVGAGLSVGARTRVEQLVGVLTAGSAAGALAVSLSRGSWIGAALAFVVLIVLSQRARRYAVVAILAVAAVGVPVISQIAPQLWEVLLARASVLLERGSNPDDARPFIYREALRQILDRPLTGQGPGNYVSASQMAESTTPGLNALHAHDVLLTVAAEAGVLAALVLVAFTISLARAVLRARWELPEGDRELMFGLACGLVAVVGQGVVDFPFRNPVLLMMVWLLTGLVFAATGPAMRRSPAVPGRRRPAGDDGEVADPAGPRALDPRPVPVG